MNKLMSQTEPETWNTGNSQTSARGKWGEVVGGEWEKAAEGPCMNDLQTWTTVWGWTVAVEVGVGWRRAKREKLGQL